MSTSGSVSRRLLRITFPKGFRSYCIRRTDCSGWGPFRKPGRPTLTVLPGGSFFDSSLSFAMIRGGHIDLTVLGAFEVSEKGDIASWKVPGKLIKGMGGAMDLVASAKNIIVAMQHTNKEGQSKLLKECTLPLTGVGCVKRIVSDLAVLDVTDKGFKLLERAPGVSVEQIQKATEGTLIIEGDIPEISF